VTLSLTASCSASTKCSRIAPKKKDHKNKARKSLTSKFQYLIRPRKSLAETDCSRKGAWKHTTQAETSKRSRLRKGLWILQNLHLKYLCDYMRLIFTFQPTSLDRSKGSVEQARLVGLKVCSFLFFARSLSVQRSEHAGHGQEAWHQGARQYASPTLRSLQRSSTPRRPLSPPFPLHTPPVDVQDAYPTPVGLALRLRSSHSLSSPPSSPCPSCSLLPDLVVRT
jgi:hypothetical protein